MSTLSSRRTEIKYKVISKLASFSNRKRRQFPIGWFLFGWFYGIVMTIDVIDQLNSTGIIIQQILTLTFVLAVAFYFWCSLAAKWKEKNFFLFESHKKITPPLPGELQKDYR